MSLLELFCHVDTFCQAFVPHWDQQLRTHGQRIRQRSGQLALSEIMTMSRTVTNRTSPPSFVVEDRN